MTPHSHQLIVVMGVTGSGKSTLAEALATHYGCHYLDADDFHPESSKAMMAQGIPLTDQQRDPWVRSIKEYVDTESIRTPRFQATLAFSGLKAKHRDILRQSAAHTIFLFLNTDATVIQERVSQRKNHFMSPQLVASQFDSLEDPRNEPNVYTLDAQLALETLVDTASKIVDQQQPSSALAAYK
jgi:gluconokinase